MKPKYIIVQAGGKGTRLKHLTANKPKALVPVGNLPMLFHLFRQFPAARYIIIADYKADVMRSYLAAFAEVQYLVIDAKGHEGTCAGIAEAVSKLPGQEPFMLIWSDLVLPRSFEFPIEKKDYIGLSKDFECRWRYQNGQFEEIPSSEAGVAGLFLFAEKSSLKNVPQEGEFVRWLQLQKRIFAPLSLPQTQEFGLLSVLEKKNEDQRVFQCRPFNQIKEDSQGKLVKQGIDQQGKDLAVREKMWYRYVKDHDFTYIPKIYSYEPLTMECIKGKNIYDYELSYVEKRSVLSAIIQCLRQLHMLGSCPTDYFSIDDAYIRKTWKRLERIRDLVPFANQEKILINGKWCRNVFFYKAEVEEKFSSYRCEKFVLLHGDNTFSNLMLNERMEPIMIDPRGYFGHTELYGDPAYDWAKLYYSIVGNYDQFNRKRFRLSIRPEDVELKIESNGWEDMEEEFFRLLEDEVSREQIRVLHAIIWLSLTTYAWEDYDSICGAFYNGLYYLEDVL